ncbi:MAG: phosphoribosylformylglycinamidine synthase subunit PurS [Thermoleophilia bacterium]|nr:phosphoribosylformylglycinamidine synthase subunit PurS [Thermoleophilia bacterium]
MSRVVITVMPRAEVLDPQGQAVERALRGLGFDDANGVRVGKRIELEIDGPDPAQTARRMCEALLANPLIEDFHVEVE